MPLSAPTHDPDDPPPLAARKLLRAAIAGTLATSANGQPYAALVTPATAPDLSILLLLSGLSEHTRHLATDPRCAVMVAGPAIDANPQTAPRLTVTGRAAPEPDPALKARWIARHPYAAFYAGLGDFRLVRITITGAHFVGGFARAARIALPDLLPDAMAAASIAAAEPDIIAHCNSDHPDAMAAIAGEPGVWAMTAVDPDGCDLARDDRVRRVDFPELVADPDGVRRALILLARASRGER